uniref:Ycf20 n=1 Tax=Derbesia sp. WEST4838 TaxID=1847751 RepID=A0A1C9JBE3_9CHLO|nr:hypothetical protein [Derbesia sp. WEST4838]AOP19167.1 hypothetical protein [Derbesia sp. WEST4838]
MRIFIYLNLYTYFCFGFFFGNLFGNFVNLISIHILNIQIGNFSALMTFIILFEFYSFINQIYSIRIPSKKIYAIRLGLLIGFCIDAFKVGS